MKKIMFNDKYELTKAVLEGRKTQTRRLINPQPTYNDNFGICWKGYGYGLSLSWDKLNGCYRNFISGTEYDKSCRRYRKDEVVAVAQSYKDLGHPEFSPDISPKDYKVTRGTLGKSKGWKNKMFVRAEACKYQIRITNVRIEHLQDISDEDCLKEGIIKKWHAPACKNYYYVPGVEVKSVKDVKKHDYERLDIINHNHAGNISRHCTIGNLCNKGSCYFSSCCSYCAVIIHRAFNHRRLQEIPQKQMTMTNPIIDNRIVNDTTFAVRLKSFIDRVDVCDCMGEEEKEYIQKVAAKLIKYQVETVEDEHEKNYLKNIGLWKEKI